MISILPFTDYATAHTADLQAFAYLKQDDNARGAQWSGVYSDGTRYGILYSPEIAPAFDDTVLGAADTQGNRAKVIQVQQMVRDAQGNITTPGWETYTPPAL